MKKMSGILWGIAITAVGVILALNAIGLTDINIFFHGWWTLFIIVPSFIGLVTDRNKTGSIIGLCIGVCLLLGCLGILSLSMVWKLLVPAVIVVIGVRLIIRAVMPDKGARVWKDIKVEGDYVIVQRQFDDRYHVLKAKMPCLITALSELNEPRYMTPGGIFDAYKKDITVWGRANLVDVLDSNLGMKGSPTQIAKASDKVRKGAGEKVTLDPAGSADYIVEKLLAKHVL